MHTRETRRPRHRTPGITNDSPPRWEVKVQEIEEEKKKRRKSSNSSDSNRTGKGAGAGDDVEERMDKLMDSRRESEPERER